MRIRTACLHKIVSCLVIGLGLAASSLCARANFYFVSNDFSVVIQPEQSSVQPGQAMTFDAILYNHSSQPADFATSGGNISLVGVSDYETIDGNNLYYSPYISSITFLPDSLYQTIAPGSNFEFRYLVVATKPSVPLGSVVTIGPGNWLFQNVPPSTGSLDDFYIPMNAASETVVAVPEPGTFLLAGLPLLILAFGRLRRRLYS